LWKKIKSSSKIKAYRHFIFFTICREIYDDLYKKGWDILKKIQWNFLLYSFLAVAAMIGIGISVSFQSITLIFTFIVLLILIMGFGFRTKKKMRESGKL